MKPIPLLIFLFFGFVLISGCANQIPGESGGNNSTAIQPEKNNSIAMSQYRNITPKQLDEMLEDDSIFLMDVHIPEQEHINGTDLVTPYNDIEFDKLPKDKQARIVVYCRSGSMSLEASQELIRAGYENVLNLAGGIKAWDKYMGGKNSSDDDAENISESSELVEKIIPTNGTQLPIAWGDFWPELVEEGVINISKMNNSMRFSGGLTDDQLGILINGSDSNVVINHQNSKFIVNMVWAFGLSNRNPILEEGPMVSNSFPVGNYASTGGWTLGDGPGPDYYNSLELVNLTQSQQEIVENATRNIYRPCCNNPAYFPDCNHGMAILGLAQMMASENMSEQDIYDASLVLNSYWFPQTYVSLGAYFEAQGTEWEDVDSKELLSFNYSSGSGWYEWKQRIDELDIEVYSSGSCGA
jgi:rhodanese-related sulfurtransferase